MACDFVIQPLHNGYCKKIIDLILPIQQVEFHVPITLEGQSDLLDIETNYQKTGGAFWGAVVDEELIGTIALISIDDHAGAIRKMFVKKELRGKELNIAQQLFETLVQYSVNNQITDLYLGTVDMLKAAHRFYERNGFQRIKKSDLPSCFPVMMSENIYYHLHL